MLDIIDNNFLDQAAKTAIIKLLDDSRATLPEGPENKSDRDRKLGSMREAAQISLAAISTVTGALVAFGTAFFANEQRWDSAATAEIGKVAILALAMMAVLGLFITVIKTFTERFTMSLISKRKRDATISDDDSLEFLKKHRHDQD